jgi:ubiquinone biosynthesis protein
VTKEFQMQTQPQLLLLQKSMLTAEGVGRRLDPTVNIWDLARPLIESWMRENRGPEAIAAERLAAVLETLGRLPAVVRDAEAALAQIADGGLKLHPASLDRVLDGWSRRRARSIWRLWAASAVVIAALALMFA